MSSYDDIIRAATARIIRNARIVGPLEHACRLADVTPQALADDIGMNRRHVAWYDFGGGDLEETRRLARLAMDFINARSGTTSSARGSEHNRIVPAKFLGLKPASTRLLFSYFEADRRPLSTFR